MEPVASWLIRLFVLLATTFIWLGGTGLLVPLVLDETVQNQRMFFCWLVAITAVAALINIITWALTA